MQKQFLAHQLYRKQVLGCIRAFAVARPSVLCRCVHVREAKLTQNNKMLSSPHTKTYLDVFKLKQKWTVSPITYGSLLVGV